MRALAEYLSYNVIEYAESDLEILTAVGLCCWQESHVSTNTTTESTERLYTLKGAV